MPKLHGMHGSYATSFCGDGGVCGGAIDDDQERLSTVSVMELRIQESILDKVSLYSQYSI